MYLSKVKGAAAALSRKELIVKGKEPYTPMEMFEVSRSGNSGAHRELEILDLQIGCMKSWAIECPHGLHPAE